MKVIILLGAPGAGKGSTAEVIRDTGYRHLSTGDLLRQAVKDGTDAGKEADGYMKRGELVPDEVIVKLVEEQLDEGGSEAMFLFDGFPRTTVQAELLDASLGGRDGAVDKVFLLETPRDVLINRLTGRRICRDCGKNFHAVNIPPKVEGVCDDCGGELYQRPDDCEETIVNRLDVFKEQTEALIGWYEDKGLLAKVNGNRPAVKIVADIESILA